MSEYHPIEQPDEIPLREKEDAMGAYLMMFASIGAGLPLPVLNLVASVIYYFFNKSKSRFVHFHLLQSLFSQIPVTLLNAVAVIWGVRIFLNPELVFTNTFGGYLVVIAFCNIVYLTFSIIAAIRAKKGRMYYFLFFGRLCYHQAYKIKPEHEKGEAINTPPEM